MKARLIAAAVAAFALGGCATDAKMREVAGSSASLVNTFKHGTQVFVSDMNDLNAADAARLRRLASQTQAMSIRSASAVMAWEAIGDDESSTMYDALTKSQSGDVLANSAVLNAIKPQAAVTPIAADAKPFDSLVQKLNALAAQPTYPQLLQSWFAFGKQVNDALNADMKAAGAAMKSTPAPSLPPPPKL